MTYYSGEWFDKDNIRTLYNFTNEEVYDNQFIIYDQNREHDNINAIQC